MGLGDEIMALGRADAIFEETGKPAAICRWGGYPREHDAWLHSPSVDKNSKQKIDDGGGLRPYIKCWEGRSAIYNLDYKARAGKICLTDEEIAFNNIQGEYAVISPDCKATASPNKNWGIENWEKVIDGIKIPVYQLLESKDKRPIRGAIGLHTPTFRHAASIIKRAKLVMCNEGGSHHMAASFGVPAVVIFGSFVPPKVTGYDFHVNISVETPHGFCGNFDYCQECQNALKTITPEQVRAAVDGVLHG